MPLASSQVTFGAGNAKTLHVSTIFAWLSTSIKVPSLSLTIGSENKYLKIPLPVFYNYVFWHVRNVYAYLLTK